MARLGYFSWRASSACALGLGCVREVWQPQQADTRATDGVYAGVPRELSWRGPLPAKAVAQQQ